MEFHCKALEQVGKCIGLDPNIIILGNSLIVKLMTFSKGIVKYIIYDIRFDRIFHLWHNLSCTRNAVLSINNWSPLHLSIYYVHQFLHVQKGIYRKSIMLVCLRTMNPDCTHVTLWFKGQYCKIRLRSTYVSILTEYSCNSLHQSGTKELFNSSGTSIDSFSVCRYDSFDPINSQHIL